MPHMPSAFHPKARKNQKVCGRSSGFARFSGGLPVPGEPEQWLEVLKNICGLTATGIAPDLHRIPY